MVARSQKSSSSSVGVDVAVAVAVADVGVGVVADAVVVGTGIFCKSKTYGPKTKCNARVLPEAPKNPNPPKPICWTLGTSPCFNKIRVGNPTTLIKQDVIEMIFKREIKPPMGALYTSNGSGLDDDDDDDDDDDVVVAVVESEEFQRKGPKADQKAVSKIVSEHTKVGLVRWPRRLIVVLDEGNDNTVTIPRWWNGG